jgi:hypothetical protein
MLYSTKQNVASRICYTFDDKVAAADAQENW